MDAVILSHPKKDTDSHFDDWVQHYNEDLKELHMIFDNAVEKIKKHKKDFVFEVSHEKFVNFIYRYSSGHKSI